MKVKKFKVSKWKENLIVTAHYFNLKKLTMKSP